MKALIPLSLAALLALAGCAARMGATPAAATPAGVPRSAPQKAPSQPATPDRSVVGTGGEASPAAPTPAVPAAPAPAAATPPAATPPAAVASAYVFAPQQAASARPSSLPPESAPPELPPAAPAPEGQASAPSEAPPSQRQDEAAGKTPGELQLLVVASAAEIATGAILTVDVMASSSTAVVDAPLHLTFDPKVVEFVDGSPGDFLTKGGSSIVFFADGQSRPGDVAIAAGRVEREQGASGAGLLCRVRLRGVAVGATPVLVGRAKAWGARGEELTVVAGGTTVVVR